MAKIKKEIDTVSRPMACLMAFLFGGGILLAGSDWVTFPYGQVIGLPMMGSVVLIANRIEAKR